jgi:hypothetical protein
MIDEAGIAVGEGVADDTPVAALRWLGAKSGAQLGAIGIHTAGDLKRVGVIEAYLMMKRAGMPASLNFVWAMYAGLMGWDFRAIAPEFKAAVKAAIRDAEAGL